MKKQFVLLSLVLCFMISLKAQNVGVGTATPASKLEVHGISGDENSAGTLRLTNTTGSTNFKMGTLDGTRSWIQSFSSLPLHINRLGNNLILNETAGNVGIGTASPANKLHVNGASRLAVLNQGYSTTERFYPNVISDAQNTTVNGAWIIHSPIPRGTDAMFTIRVHGYGYSSFDVIDFTISGYAYSGVVGNIDGQPGKIINTKLSDVGTDNWHKYVGVDNAGNVAIAFGNTSSSAYYYRLSVDAWVTLVNGDYSTGWSIDRNTTTNFNWRDITGPMTSSIKGAIAINSSGQVNITGMSASSTVYTDASGNLTTAVPSTSPDLYWTRSGTSMYNTNTGDNVGIGLSSPQKRLDVLAPVNDFVTVGANTLSPGQYAGIHFGYRENNTAYRKSAIVFERTDNSGGGGNAAGRIHLLNGPASGSGSATMADARLTIGETGNVGIGTISPTQKLDVSGNITTSGHISQGPLITHPQATWSVGGNSTGAVIIKLPGNTANYGMLHMQIDVYEYGPTGVTTYIVGGHNWNGLWYNYNCHTIGSSTKKVRLAVKDGQYCVVIGEAGSTWSYGHVVLSKITNGGYYSGIIDLKGTYNVYQDASAESYTWITGDLNSNVVEGVGGSANYLARWTSANTLGIGVSYDNGTNVGIGTTSPVDKLDINGHLSFTGTGREIRFRNGGGSTDQYVWHSGTSLGLGAGSTGNSMFITSAGNVGIGTGSPAYKVDVVGQLHNYINTTLSDYTYTNCIFEQANSAYNSGITLRNTYYGNGVVLYGQGSVGGLNVGSITTITGYVPVTALSYTSTSDISTKKDVEYLDENDFSTCLEQIRNIQSIRYRYLSESETKGTEKHYRPNLHIGVVAQSLPAEVVDTISADPSRADGQKRLGMSLNDMDGLMLAGMKALDAKDKKVYELIEKQQQQIEALQKEIESLKKAK